MKPKMYQLNNSIEEWGSQWKERLKSSGGSKVIQKWNALGKKPKVESSTEYAKKQAQPQRTWRSDVADTFHNIGEGVLALSPYTAMPYYGAKVGQDFLNGNVGVHTALNATVPLFSGIGKIPNKNQIYKTIQDGLWFLKNPRSIKIYHGSKNNFDLINARTASPNNLGLHVTSKKEIADKFAENGGYVKSAFIPRYNMETIDIGANDYRLISNDLVFDSRQAPNFYDASGNSKLFYKLLKKYGAEPSYELNPEYTSASKVITTKNRISLPLRDETWKNISSKTSSKIDKFLKEIDFGHAKTPEDIEYLAKYYNQEANNFLSNNGKKIIKYNNVNPYEGGGGTSYIVTDPKVFYSPQNYNIPSIIQNTTKYIKFPLIYESNKSINK